MTAGNGTGKESCQTKLRRENREEGRLTQGNETRPASERRAVGVDNGQYKSWKSIKDEKSRDSPPLTFASVCVILFPDESRSLVFL